MERVLGILGSAMLLSVLSILFLIVDADDQRRPEPSVEAETPFEELSDEEKLQRIRENRTADTTTLMNRADAYDDPSYCDKIRDRGLRRRCLDRVSQATPVNDTADNTSDSESGSTDDQRAYNRALAYDESSRCDNIEDETLRQTCREEVKS